MLKFLKPVMLITFLASAALMGCEQQEVKVENADAIQKVDIPTLTEYFANRINVEVDDIKYDKETQQFSLGGVDQVSLEKLTRFYLNSQTK